MFRFWIENDLELRLVEDRHTQELFELTEQNRDYLRQWFSYLDSHRSIEDVRRVIKSELIDFAGGTRLSAGIWFEGKLAGMVGYDRIDWSHRLADLGYWVAAPLQGKGIVTKSCRALLDYAFDELKLNRVEARCATENRKSRAIPERLGFKQEGTIRQAQWIYDRVVDHAIYGMLSTEWQSLKKLQWPADVIRQ